LHPEENRPDAALLDAAARGDSDAFAVLMTRHEEKVFALALRITGSRADALDASQDAFVAVYRKAGAFRGDAAFSTWLYRIAVNACNDLLRKKARQPRPEEDDHLVGLPSSDRAVEDVTVDRLDVKEALAALPEEYRTAVAMYDLAGIPYEEIARATGVAVGTVKSRISRGRRRLAVLLEHPGRREPSKEET
jgi:RNA polymerase sigma-70 factor (ECF subfamily)